MLKFYPLFSGSSGNMYLIKSPKSTVLVDIGVSFKSALSALNALGIDISNIDSLLITHEHSDHTKGFSTLVNQTSIPIYTTYGTSNHLLNKFQNKLKKSPSITYVDSESSFMINDMLVTPFTISHDAVDPVGFRFKHENSSLTIATDLGYVSDDVYKHLLDSSFSVIESNYDKNLLLYGPYTYPLKCRIQSDIGHLSNDDTSNVILNLAKEGKRNFLLGHISKNNNEPEQALYTVNSTLTRNGFDIKDFNISYATRDVSYEVYNL